MEANQGSGRGVWGMWICVALLALIALSYFGADHLASRGVSTMMDKRHAQPQFHAYQRMKHRAMRDSE